MTDLTEGCHFIRDKWREIGKYAKEAHQPQRHDVYAPINAEQIDPRSMTNYFRSVGNLSINGDNYKSIFSALSKMNRETELKLLTDFYTLGVMGFPNGAELALYLSGVHRNVREYTDQDHNGNDEDVREMAKEALRRLGLRFLPIIITDDTIEAENQILTLDIYSTIEARIAELKYMNPSRKRASNVARCAVLGIVDIKTKDNQELVRLMQDGIDWVVFSDLIYQKKDKRGILAENVNPFVPLLDIIAVGYQFFPKEDRFLILKPTRSP